MKGAYAMRVERFILETNDPSLEAWQRAAASGIMDKVSFEWDHGKATANLQKHQVSFDEASTVFDDLLGAIFHDEYHSTAEVREIIIGHSTSARILLVCFTERPKNLIRI